MLRTFLISLKLLEQFFAGNKEFFPFSVSGDDVFCETLQITMTCYLGTYCTMFIGIRIRGQRKEKGVHKQKIDGSSSPFVSEKHWY